jgi:hypothetical protein
LYVLIPGTGLDAKLSTILFRFRVNPEKTSVKFQRENAIRMAVFVFQKMSRPG